MQTLYSALHEEFGTWDLAPGYIVSGTRVPNFVEGLDNVEFQVRATRVVDSLPEDFGGRVDDTVAYRPDGEYIGNDWKENPNDDEYISHIGAGRPDLLAGAAVLRARVSACARVRYSISSSSANRILGHMARRSLGAELFRRPAARRVAVWVAQWPPARLPLAVEGSCWGRQSLFLKRGQPLLVAEVFLPTLIRRHQATTG